VTASGAFGPVPPAGRSGRGAGQSSGGLERLAGGLTSPARGQPSDGLDRPSAKAFQPRGGVVQRGGHPASVLTAGLRLVRLYLVSRRVLTCLAILVACGVVLRVALQWLPHTGVLSRQIPLTIEAGAAAAIGVTARSPFGDPERAAGRWLPFLRLAGIAATAGAAVGALAAGAASAHLAGGVAQMLRDLGGFTGIALLTAVVAGGGLAFTGPLGYLAVSLAALTARWTTPWVWPARPPHDRGAAICASAVFAAGVLVVALRGTRESGRE
jgi:hypothetical protein